MGELLLCSDGLASVPYYIENIALNIYSMEELCYYLKQNIDLVEPSFMNEELIFWIQTELKKKSLAKELHKLKLEEGSLLEFVTAIAKSCNYCTGEEIKEMRRALADFENKSATECRKIRADRLLQKRRYHASILEYRKLLESPEVRGILAGNIYHNLGTAYARLFFFPDAADCYGKAYERNRNPLSLMHKEAALQLAEGVRQEPGAEDGEEDAGFQMPDTVLEQWKEEYIRSCR